MPVKIGRVVYGAACLLAAAATLLASTLPSIASEQTLELEVTVTAYNSVPEQTNEQPTIAAWGDQLAPGMKVIAVSRDLLEMGHHPRHQGRPASTSLPGDYDRARQDEQDAGRRKIDHLHGRPTSAQLPAASVASDAR